MWGVEKLGVTICDHGEGDFEASLELAGMGEADQEVSASLYAWQAPPSLASYTMTCIKFLGICPAPADLLCCLGLSSCSFFRVDITASRCYSLDSLLSRFSHSTDITVHLLSAPSVLALSSDDCLLPFCPLQPSREGAAGGPFSSHG